MTKSLEQKLFEAYAKGKGVRLSDIEVIQLIRPDHSIRQRIANIAYEEAHGEPPSNGWGDQQALDFYSTWAQLRKHHLE